MSKQTHHGALRLPSWCFRLFINLYRPYRGAGIRMVQLSPDSRLAVMSLRPRFSNRNAFGTHFGGSLYSMCDPIFVLMLARILGPDYILWDKGASIKFCKPGRGVVTASFELPSDLTDDLQRRADAGEVLNPEFVVNVMDNEGDVVAEIHKTLYLRKRGDKTSPRSRKG